MIYFAQAGVGGPVKIGFSEAPNTRRSGIQTGSATDVEFIRQIPGGRTVEAWLHRKFKDQHIRGEWFEFCEEMLSVKVPRALQEADAPREDEQLPLEGIAPENLMEHYGRLQSAYEKGNALMAQAATSNEAFRAAIAWNEEIRRLEALDPGLHRLVEVFGKKPHASAVVARRPLTKAARSSDDGGAK